MAHTVYRLHETGKGVWSPVTIDFNCHTKNTNQDYKSQICLAQLWLKWRPEITNHNSRDFDISNFENSKVHVTFAYPGNRED
jgi:hypothetical protein